MRVAAAAVGDAGPARAGGGDVPSYAFADPDSEPDLHDESESDWFSRLDRELHSQYGISYEQVLPPAALAAMQGLGGATAGYTPKQQQMLGGGRRLAGGRRRAACGRPRRRRRASRPP